MPTPDEFDPLGDLSPEDQAYLDRQRRAMQRQQAAWANHPGQDASDVDRAKAAEEHRRATMEAAGVTPAEMSKRLEEAPPPVDPSVVASMPGAQVAGVAPVAPAGPMKLTIYKATPVVSETEIAPKGEQFAPDWKMLKGLIASHDGTWDVEQFELPTDVRAILGFFEKTGWAMVEEDIAELRKAKFGAIVKSGMVFRADPDEEV
jgi:hypothetical protein